MKGNVKDKTYYSLTKWFRGASWIVLLAPITLFILNIIHYVKEDKFPGYELGAKITGIIALVFAVIFVILNIVMFFAAKNLKGYKSPTGVRIGLFISLIFVLAGEIVDILIGARVIPHGKAADIISLIVPVVVIIGYIIGSCLAGSIQRALRK